MAKIMAVTGYKSYELNVRSANDQRIDYIKYALRQRIVNFIENGGEWILTSGQLGVELWTCEIVDELKQEYDIKYAIIPPFNNQDKKWSEHDRELYQKLIHLADYYAPLYNADYIGPYQFEARNKWLIDKSDRCLVLVESDYPGSVQYFLEEARKYSDIHDYPIEYITSFDLNEILNESQENDLTY